MILTFSLKTQILPKLARILPNTHLLTETEWRNIGIQQSPGYNNKNLLFANNFFSINVI